MATVTGLTAERMAAIEAASIVNGGVVLDNLILTKFNGQQIDAGNVRGPVGPPGPAGAGDLNSPGAHVSVSRVLNTTYQPSTTRPVLVTATVTMTVPGVSRAYIFAKCSNVSPPTYVIARELMYVYGPDQVVTHRTITFLVPVGFYYMLEGVVVLGTPTLGIDRVMEQPL